MKLTKQNLAVYRAASKDGSRYAIKGIEINPEATVATDGRILVVVEVPNQPDEDKQKLTLASGSAQKAEQLATSKEQWITVNGTEIWGAKGAVIKETVDGQFPDWKAVMGDYEGGFSIYVNPALLRRMADVLEQVAGGKPKSSKEADKRTVRMTFSPATEVVRGEITEQNPADHAIRFDTVTEHGQHVTGLLMPMREGAGIGLKDWGKKKAE